MKMNKVPKATILLYHQIGSFPLEETNLDCYCMISHFEEQMEYLYKANIEVISLAELVNILNKSKALEEDYVVLTFDDGCDKFGSTALPILEKRGFPSTIYPVSGNLGKVASWPKINNPDLVIVSEDELLNLSKKGVDIGAHTKSHVKLTNRKLDEALKEIKDSKEFLERIIGKEINSFSYPHGDYNKKIKALVRDLGFTCAVTCDGTSITEKEDMFSLPRKYVTYHDNLEFFKKILGNEQKDLSTL